ncbi:MAG: hypothetical protein H6731_01615 [Myxococcales bacterium]|nr:MAG: hypothetical protein H6731_01615 [Myxococcales bacterium]
MFYPKSNLLFILFLLVNSYFCKIIAGDCAGSEPEVAEFLFQQQENFFNWMHEMKYEHFAPDSLLKKVKRIFSCENREKKHFLIALLVLRDTHFLMIYHYLSETTKNQNFLKYHQCLREVIKESTDSGIFSSSGGNLDFAKQLISLKEQQNFEQIFWQEIKNINLENISKNYYRLMYKCLFKQKSKKTKVINTKSGMRESFNDKINECSEKDLTKDAYCKFLINTVFML